MIDIDLFAWEPLFMNNECMSMATSNAESSQWLSVTEETLFLHDGLLRVTDLVELPADVENCGSRDNEVVSFDSKDPEELSAKLLEICGTRNNAFNTLLEYRLNALRGLWKAQNSISKEDQNERESNPQDETIAITLLKKQGLFKGADQASFSTRISLLLILPLLQSQSKTDPELCGVTSGVILTCLRDCPPLSLSKEPSDCLSGLESLLCGWLGEKSEQTGTVQRVKDKKHLENAAAALVALACARGHVKTLVHAVHLLQQLSNFPPLPVADVLASLLECEGSQGVVSSFLGSRYILSWGLDDLLGPNNSAEAATAAASSEQKENNDKDKEKDQDLGRSITSDGSFLYTTNSVGKGIAKVGSGLQGTLRGYVYNKNTELGPGRLAYGGHNMLLLRPQKYDQEVDMECLVMLIDSDTLEPLKVIPKPSSMIQPGPCTTVGFCSDGLYFYWLWCPATLQDKNAKGINVNVSAFTVEKNLEVIPLRPYATLQRKEEAVQKNVNEAILNRLRPLRGSNSAATLMALTGGEAFVTNKKDESPSSGSTSCGILLKTLVRTPVYCDGNHIVMLTTPPGSNPGGGTRSLFGGGGPMPSLRTLASNLCFNVKTGYFSARMDFVEAHSSSVGRGTPLTNICTCFDVVNNLLWMSSGEYVDQFQNPGNLPPHHIQAKLGISDTVLPTSLTGDNLLPMSQVTTILLHTVSSMCLHQMTGDSIQHRLVGSQASAAGSSSLSPGTSFGAVGGQGLADQEQILDLQHLTRVTDILARAMKDKDEQAVICCLVVMQLIFKKSPSTSCVENAEEPIKTARNLIWTLLTRPSGSREDLTRSEAVKTEACHVITKGLRCLYPTSQDRHALLYQMLTSGESSDALIQLRDMILTDFSQQLNLLQASPQDHSELQFLLLNDDLVAFILKLAVKESCSLLRKAQGCNKDDFNKMLFKLPLASPAVMYLSSLRSYHLHCAVVRETDEEEGDQSHLPSLESIQAAVLNLSCKMISGACEVLETYLETCSAVLGSFNSSNTEYIEGWLAGLERLAKSTILGSLMPVLITALTHKNLQCLNGADALTPSLVSLSLLASKAALVLKTQELAANSAINSDTDLDPSSDKEIADLIGEALSAQGSDMNLEEEEGFLTGLKIPTPWASGKTVETIHPVRDNYRFMETVHIPGARCLYLRFDPRCSSQYDYDKVVVYAGAGVKGKKVAEYGGNSFGYGSRSVLGNGWPKDLVKVEGDTVSLNFEMRSGREHNTPDKAMWGFACTIRAQESAEEVTPGLPFLSDLALGLSVLVGTQLGLLYHGSPQSQDEIQCQHLLKSKLLQRCVWNTERLLLPDIPLGSESSSSGNDLAEESSTVSNRLPRIRLSADRIQTLHKLVKRQPLRLRPSVRATIQLEVLEESVISAVTRHLGLTDTVRDLTSVIENKGDDLTALTITLEETYRRFDVLVRQLQMMAELEKRWVSEVEDKAAITKDDTTSQNSAEPPFFHDFHLQEMRHKDLVILAFLKEVTIENSDLETAVKDLLDKFESDVEKMREKSKKKKAKQAQDPSKPEKEPKDKHSKSRTQQVVNGILARLELLLQVASVPSDAESALTRTLSQSSGFKGEDLMVRSDTEVMRHVQGGFGRSMSAPVGVDPDLHSHKSSRWRHLEKFRRSTSVLQDLVDDGEQEKAPHVVVIDQLFVFIGSDPEKAVSCEKFLNAAAERYKRGCIRRTALNHMKDLLAAASHVGGATHLVAAVASVLRHGPKVDDLRCGGMVSEVREAFAEAMSSVVQLAALYPLASASSIGLLCTIPYTRAEEKCLVRSGLVHLLDKLCSLGSHRADGLGAETQTPRQKVSALAWAGFQVLASRCVKWEVEDSSHVEDLEHSGLAKQVSTLLTHHLARATEGIGNAMAGTEALQEVLSLLNNLSRSKMGKAILSQPACVSKLLSLLLDQRPSPKLVLIILQLCRVSLPLMNAVDCEEVELPSWGQQLYSSHWSNAQPVSDPPAKIICLLLAKLGDFLVPGDQVLLTSRSPSQDLARASKSGEVDKSEESDVHRGKMSVFVHKREDQTAHDIIQPLLSCDHRPFRLAGNANMDKVLRLDRELTKNGKAELTTEDAVNAFKKAYKWAQMGLVISTAPPTDTTPASPENNTSTDKKKVASEVICKEKNSELARTDPVRAFISGHVANAMAAEVIALLHNLLSAQISSTAHTWSQAVQRVLANALSGLPLLLSSLDALSSPRSPRSQTNHQLMSLAKLANAALCAMGAFSETIKPGCEVKVTGEGIKGSFGVVQSVSDQNDVVTIQLNNPADTEEEFSPTYSDVIKVPIGRVQPIRNEMFSRHQNEMNEAVISAVKAVVLPPDENTSPLIQPLHSSGDGNTMANQICRVVAEIRTRTSVVLSQCLQDIDFAKIFIEHCGYSLDMLKSLAKDCSPGSRLPVVESHCQRLRLLYRDCAKPPPPPCRTDIRPSKEMVWDVMRPFPPSRACMFSQGMTAVAFLGDPSAKVGLPRGTMIYANQPIPKEAPSFYWELEVASFGDAQDESATVVSFGFAPLAEKKDGAWTNPIGTCLFLNTGKAVHYNGASLLQWRSVRLEVTLNVGDVAGIGWERTGDLTDTTQTPKGQVYFTYNGQRLSASLDNVSGAMYPVVHIQKKNCRVKANFGARPFAFAEGQQHREAAEAANDVLRDIRESFGHLPFHAASDSESDGTEATPQSAEVDLSQSSSRDSRSPPKAACRVATPPPTLKEYDTDVSQSYKLLPSYDNFVVTGADSMFVRPTEEDSDDEAVVDESALEDHYALLVKAWEQKVFPVIRRRFRNEAERKDGLEQIRGALQLGMTDIARQTVEFLYEENGGIPRDLHLPTIDDIKEDLAKFTIDRVKKGTTVIIRTPSGLGSQATTQLPKFAVRSMLKTFGLTGTVLDVDTTSELVQVETYLRSEGVLVRFWYPLLMLEKPAQGMRKASITGGQTMDTSNIYIHRELLSSESVLTRMYLRTAFLRLTDHCNSPAMEVTTCSASLGSGMAACAATLQELDLENIQLLSEHVLSSPFPTGTLECVSPFQTSLLSQLSLEPLCSLTSLVYRNPLRLKRELATAIARASNQGEDYLIELTNQLCMCLQTAPELFPSVNIPVNETKVATDMCFPGAACILVSCVKSSEANNKENTPYRSPWARISTYTGKRIRRCGQVTRQEVVCYPRDIHNQSNSNDQYAPSIIPGDKVYVKIGVSSPPNVTVTLHALPAQFLLAVAYMETLVTETFGCGTQACGSARADRAEKQSQEDVRADKSSNSSTPMSSEASNPSLWSLDNICITPPVFLHMIEFLCGYLWKTEVPALMKEYMFHLLAQTLRVLRYSEGQGGSMLTKLSTRLSPTQGMLTALPKELKKLYDMESKNFPAMTTSAGQGIGLGVTDTGLWSTYLHALMEVCLAISEVIPCEMITAKEGTEPGTEEGASGTSSTTPSPGTSSSKKKKVKAKKVTARRSSTDQSTTGADTTEVSEPSSSSTQQTQSQDSPLTSPPNPRTSSSASMTMASASPTQTIQVDNMPWFPSAVSLAKILRYLALKEEGFVSEVNSAVKTATQSLLTSTAHSRLLILTGLPSYLDVQTVKKSIRTVCNGFGGLDRDEIFIPTPSDLEGMSQGSVTQFTSFQNVTEASASQNAPESKSETAVGQVSSTTTAPTTTAVTTTSSLPPPPSSASTDGSQKKKPKLIAGYAVISLPSKTKVETVRNAFLKTKWLNVSVELEEGDSPIDGPEENLNVYVVKGLLTEAEANAALENYLSYKLSGKVGATSLGDTARQVLSEIFYSCYFADQQQQESGDICLSKEQILNQTSENLLAAFFNAVRPCKKPVSDAVTGVLRQYGLHKARDKDPSPSGPDKSSKGKTTKKPSSRSLKEKQALTLVEKGQEEKCQSDKEKHESRKDSGEKEKSSKEAEKEGAVADLTVKESKSSSKSETRLLTLDNFMHYCEDMFTQDPRGLWKGLIACGLDLHLERCACPDTNSALSMMNDWTLEKDIALVNYVNERCCQLAIASSRLHPHEVRLTEAQLTNEKYSCLQGLPVESIRLRFAFLQTLNNALETQFFPLIDLRPGRVYSRSTAYILSQLRSIIFYDSKVNFLNRILNATAKRNTDQAAPEITLNPLENIGGTGEKNTESSILCQSYRQLSSISSKKLCVKLASGGDPTYSFNVRMTGEEVHGTSGSFRHYLWQVARELQSSSLLGLLVPCPSSSAGHNKGRLLLSPGPMTYSEENLLMFLGQLLGITIRADIPLGLDLLSTVWKLLVGLTLDPSPDLKEADILTYDFMKKIEMAESESELESICGDVDTRFVYPSLTGQDVELVPDGRAVSVSWHNHQVYIDTIRQLRMRELTSSHRAAAIVTGLASLIPYQVLSMMSPLDLEIRTSGRPFISLNFLKSHTMYQVGLVESDPHIEYFWAALESFSQEELARFIKFACNQERIPQTCPCQEGGPDTAHVPPYPMKIAPPDGSGQPDLRYIRVETCMFMVKLPQYSCQEVMTHRLRYAINCREDPLSG